MAAQQNNSNIRLLACLIDDDDVDESDYRFAVDEKHVEYTQTAPGMLLGAEDDRTLEPILVGELRPPFPAEDWNEGHLARDPETGEAAFLRTETLQLPGAENLWHRVKLNELDFARQDRMRQRVHISTYPEINGGQPVVFKIAVWPWEVPFMETETTIYRLIKESDIGPKFLGHVTQGVDGRVVGFIAEHIEGARSAAPGDIDECRNALGKLHEFGIKMGDINRHNFLVRDCGGVVLIDFEFAERDCSPLELKNEMDALESSLNAA